MNKEKIEMQPAELLKAIYNNLNRHFFKVSKNEAKSRYRELESGMEVPFLKISLRGHGEVACKLALDHTQFAGKLNFRQFRNALASHLYRIEGKLTNNMDLNIFTSQETGGMIFHIPGLVETDDTINILVTGLEQRAVGQATVRLMFLDPQHFSDRSG